MVFFRQLQHLLPDALAWRLTATSKTLRKFFEGLAAAPADLRTFVDSTYDDLLPAKTRELPTWQRQFGLLALGTDAEQRAQLASAWQAQGGQSPRYLQDVVRAAGFDVYIHEWWEPGTMPRVKRDPRAYTVQPQLGSTQCGQTAARCGEVHAACNRWLQNDVKYLVNRNLTPLAPPPVPDDPARWPHFLYWGGATFGTAASVLAARRTEFERLLLKICPAHCWLVTIVNYT